MIDSRLGNYVNQWSKSEWVHADSALYRIMRKQYSVPIHDFINGTISTDNDRLIIMTEKIYDAIEENSK